MQTPKLRSKNLFTLNRDSNQKSSNNKRSENSSYNQSSPGYNRNSSHHMRPSQITQNSSDNQSVQYSSSRNQQLTSLRLKIRAFQKKQSALNSIISDLQNENQLLNQKLQNSQHKTKELIQKLSKHQVNNKQYEYQLKIHTYQLNKNKEVVQSLNHTIAQLAIRLKEVIESIEMIQESPDVLYNALKNVKVLELDINVDRAMTYIQESHDQNDFMNDNKMIKGINNKGTKNFKGIKEWKKQTERLMKELETQKQQKKRILPSYNELLNKMRNSCQVLKQKVEQVYHKSNLDREYFQEVISQKDLYIKELELKNEKLVQHSRRKDSFKQKQKQKQKSKDKQKDYMRQKEHKRGYQRSQQSPKMFIGDYKKTKLKKELSQIDREIEEIQNNLREELSSSRYS